MKINQGINQSINQSTHLGLTWLTATPRFSAKSSLVSSAGEMMPTPRMMALAVMEWSPVSMITCKQRTVVTMQATTNMRLIFVKKVDSSQGGHTFNHGRLDAMT
jgi:hypothetical protein